METYFKQQDEFLAEMISAYENNLLNKEYEPYFAWKQGSPLFNRKQCLAMWQKVREQLDTLYEHAQPEVILGCWGSWGEFVYLRYGFRDF